MKKFLAIFLSLTMCVSLGIVAFAAPEDETGVTEATTIAAENTTVAAENTTVAAENTTVAAENTTVAAENTTVAAEETTVAPEEPTTEEKKDILELVMAFLQSIKFDEVKDSLNDISEALGFPRVETVADLAAFADAVVDKLGEVGLSYEQIVNMIKADDLINWLQDLMKKPAGTTAAPAADDDETTAADGESVEKNPHTGVSAKAAIAAAVTAATAAAAVFVFKKREEQPVED